MESCNYTIGRIRSLEARMLSEEKILRLASAESFAAAFAVLNETVYADHLGNLKNPFDFEELLALERQAVKDLLDQAIPEKNFQNIEYFQELMGMKADLQNLKIWLRLKELNATVELLKNSLRTGGKIDLSLLIELFGKNPEDLASRFKFSDYGQAFSGGLVPLPIMEKLLDNILIAEYKKTKYLARGIQPLVGFWLAKEQEIQTIRFILVCKQNFISTELIKERLRESYV